MLNALNFERIIFFKKSITHTSTLMKYLNLIFFTFLVLFSCNPSNQDQSSELDLKTIQVHNENDILPDGILNLESTVPLEFCEDCIVGMVDRSLWMKVATMCWIKQ